MSDKSAKVTVSLYGESVTMWALLVDPMYKDDKLVGMSRKEWFPKSICTLERNPPETINKTAHYYHTLTAPIWLLKKKNIKFDNGEKTEQGAPENKEPAENGITTFRPAATD